jgi:hypothetical protein
MVGKPELGQADAAPGVLPEWPVDPGTIDKFNYPSSSSRLPIP